MGQDRHISGNEDIEEEVLKPDRSDMVGRLDENITGVRERQKVPRPQARNKILNDVIVGAGDQLERDRMFIQCELQLRHGIDDLRAGIVIDAGKDVWRTGHNRYAVAHKGARHLQRDRQIARTIVDAGQNVAVQIDHCDLAG